MRKPNRAIRLAALLVVIATFAFAAPVGAQEGKGGPMPDPVAQNDVGDWVEIVSFKVCTDGVAYTVRGYNTEPNETWWNDSWLGDPPFTDLHATDFSPLGFVGAFETNLFYYFTSAYGATIPLAPGTMVYFDAYQWLDTGGGGGVPAWDARVEPAEDCSIDDWLYGQAWVTCLTSMPLFTTDTAPADGVVEVRTLFGDLFRPEGWTQATISVTRGQQLNTEVLVGCGRYVRVWYTPVGGTPTLLPSQYYPDDFGSGWDGTASYHTSFAGRVAPTDPLEDPGTSE